MKKNRVIIGIICVCLLSIAAIHNLYAQNKDSGNKIVYLNKESYLKLIHNYEKNPTWKYEGKKPAIIDFYADWCGPCRKIAPILEELSVKYDKKIQIYKVNVDQEKALATQMKVNSIPMLMFIPMKGDPKIVRGAISKDEFEKLITEVLLVK